ncbi:MAG: hypothetical protein JWO59_2835, partial [Chloroflexi bacterium]|nr:hypothetical protein [Chloroflexota bacterium]
PSVGNHLIQARYIPNPGFLPSQSGYIIQSVRTCSASGVLPTNGQMGLLASVTNGATPSNLLQFRAASQGFTANSAGFTVNNAQVVACFNPDPNFGVAIALGTIAKRVGDSIPSNISNNLGQPQVGDVVLLGLLHIDTYSFGLIGTATINGLTFGTATPSNCIYNSNVCNLWANVFFPPYNSAAGITITTP